jgi:hypothetical protein
MSASYLDFSNGFIAYARTTGDVRLLPDHTGLTYPAVELPVSENAVLGGASIGTARAKARRMAVPLYFRVSTRAAIAAAFFPGVERTVSSALGSMPYYVEDVVFRSLNLKGPQVVTVVIVSPLAYPEGPVALAEIAASGWTDPAVAISQLTWDADTAANSGYETFPLTAGHQLVSVTLKAGAGGGLGACSAALYATAAGVATGAALANVAVPQMGKETDFVLPFAFIVPATGTYAVKFLNTLPGGGSAGGCAKNTAGGYASGSELSAANTVVTGDDLYFIVTTAVLAVAVGSVTFDSDTEVPCAPVVTVVMQSSDTSLVLAGEGWTTTLTDSFAANDVIVIDAANFTVTKNAVNALSTFDRTGEWPSVSPGSNTITVTPSAFVSATWKPRLMGLI